MAAAFQFATAAEIVFGAGKLSVVAPAARDWGTRALVVTGRDAGRAERLIQSLDAECVDSSAFPVEGEPAISTVREGVEQARAEDCDIVIAFGGGSAIDVAKAIAAILANGGDPLDYIEVVGQGKRIRLASVPFIAIPTTAGTGSEVTRNAVLASPEHHVKASLRSPLMLARLAVIDPELTHGLPPAVTAVTGLDALTQLIEPFVSARANPMTDMFCLEGIRRAARSIRRVFKDGNDEEAREDMAFASLLGGLALANAGLGVVHGFAAPIGGMFPAPHGAVCATLLPHGMEANLCALRARAPGHRSLERYAVIARIVTGRSDASAEDGLAWVRELVRDLRIPPLRDYSLSEADIPVVVENASRASSMKANPIELNPEELTVVLQNAM